MSFDLAHHITALDRDGYTIIDDFLDSETLTEVKRIFGLYLNSHIGRNGFEGLNTERIYTLVARARVFWRIVLDARIMALCDHYLLPNYLLTASQAIQINPGEHAQPFHHDDSFYHLPRPRPMVSLSTIVAVDPFTTENGGTNLIPGSHTWGTAEFAALDIDHGLSGDLDENTEAILAERAIAASLPAGACVVFSGTLVHRGGHNRSTAPRRAFSNQYCQPWARPQENFVLGVPTEVARAMPARLQALLGYSVHPPFIGQLTASHPLKALAPDYENRVVAQARAAGAQLPE